MPRKQSHQSELKLLVIIIASTIAPWIGPDEPTFLSIVRDARTTFQIREQRLMRSGAKLSRLDKTKPRIPQVRSFRKKCQATERTERADFGRRFGVTTEDWTVAVVFVRTATMQHRRSRG
jgi:hypothetical protein